MSEMFKAWLITKTTDGSKAEITDFPENELMIGDVDVRVFASTINYKDGLALTGQAPVIRRFPLVPGIDFSGEVSRSGHPKFSPGDIVVATGQGLGETHHGGLAQKARVSGDWLVPVLGGLTAQQSMAIGTAGFTAMLCVMALEDAGITPDLGNIVVSGAAGGVGSVAICLLAKLGYRVVASTGREEERSFLTSLGAADIVSREEFSGDVRSLAKSRWAGAIDVVGSNTLANLLSQMNYGGAVAACGLAQGIDLPGSVAPFILRGVRLLGIDSVMCPAPRRHQAWKRLACDLDLDMLEALTSHISFGEALKVGQKILKGEVRGRVVVDIDE